MQVFGLNAGFARLSKYSHSSDTELSAKAAFKWQVLDLLRRTANVRMVCEHYQISRATLYRWKRQFKPRSPESLEERSRRPKGVRLHQWSRELERAVIRLREEFGWGRDKLVVLLQ